MQKSFHTEESKVWRSKVSFIVILYRNHFIQKSFCTEIILYRRMQSLTLENPRPFQSQLYSHLIQKSFYTEIILYRRMQRLILENPRSFQSQLYWHFMQKLFNTEESKVWLSKVSFIVILYRNHFIQKSFYTEINSIQQNLESCKVSSVVMLHRNNFIQKIKYRVAKTQRMP